jgi:hypothetical protein
VKKYVFPAVIFAFFLPVAAQAQSSSTPSTPPTKVVTLSGKVSADAKWLIIYRKANLTVENPTLLAGHEGQVVTVKCEKDAATNMIRIVAVKSALDSSADAAKLDDAAFRR